MSKIRNQLPSSQELNSMFEYVDGSLKSRYSRSNRVQGSAVGRVTPSGYKSVKIGRSQFYEHRLIWAMLRGDLHGLDIDHINGVRGDNRIENLRLATRSENNRNLHKAKSNSKTGLLGARLHSSGKYVAQIQSGGKCLHLGSFVTAEQAHLAYMDAKSILHPSVKEAA